MRGNRLAVIIIGAVVFVGAAAVAIYIFRNEIADFFVDMKAKIDEKLLKRNSGEYVE